MSHKTTDNIERRYGPEFRKIAGLVVWFLIVVTGLSVVRNIQKVIRIRGEIEKEKVKISKMEADNMNLQKQIEETQDPVFIEKQIRNKLGLAREGEGIVVLPSPEILRKLAPKFETNEDVLPPHIWEKWYNLFAP